MPALMLQRNNVYVSTVLQRIENSCSHYSFQNCHLSQAGSFTDTALRQEEVKGPVQQASVARAALNVELQLGQFHCSKLSLNSGR